MGRSSRRSGLSDNTNRAAGPHKSILAERFRTKMCGKMVAFGFCDYEGRCMFAHSQHELRTKEQNIADDLVTLEAIKAFQKARLIAAKSAQKKRDRESAVAQWATPTPSPAVAPLPQQQPQRSTDFHSGNAPSYSPVPETLLTTAVGLRSELVEPACPPPTAPHPLPAGATHSGSCSNFVATTIVSTYCFPKENGPAPPAVSVVPRVVPSCDVARLAVNMAAGTIALSGPRLCASHPAVTVDTPRSPQPWALSRAASRADSSVYATPARTTPLPASAHCHGARDAPLVAFIIDAEPAVPATAADDSSGITRGTGDGNASHSTPSCFVGLCVTASVATTSSATFDDDAYFAASLTSERTGGAYPPVWTKSPGKEMSAGTKTSASSTPTALFDTTKFVSPLAAAMLAQRE